MTENLVFLQGEAQPIAFHNELLISPAIKLELQYLFGNGRTILPALGIIDDLDRQIGLVVCDPPFDSVINRAATLTQLPRFSDYNSLFMLVSAWR